MAPGKAEAVINNLPNEGVPELIKAVLLANHSRLSRLLEGVDCAWPVKPAKLSGEIFLERGS